MMICELFRRISIAQFANILLKKTVDYIRLNTLFDDRELSLFFPHFKHLIDSQSHSWWRHHRSSRQYHQLRRRSLSSVRPVSVYFSLSIDREILVGVGKTSIILRHDRQGFSSKVSPTLGASFITSSVTIDDVGGGGQSTIVELQIWYVKMCVMDYNKFIGIRRDRNDFVQWLVTFVIGWWFISIVVSGANVFAKFIGRPHGLRYHIACVIRRARLVASWLVHFSIVLYDSSLFRARKCCNETADTHRARK